MPFGGVVDYLINGEMVERHPATLGWGPPDDIRTMSVSEPGFEILRPHHRLVLHQAMQTYGVEKPKVGLITDRLGAKGLIFNLNEYLPDPQAVSRVSALINHLLPGYYFQGVIGNDWDVAFYPVLPLSAGVEEELPESADPRDVLDEMYRSIRRLDVAYDADAVPSQGERRWRNTAASSDARFRLDMEDMVAGTDEGTYLALRLCDSGEDGSVSFRQAALAAADAQCGLLLCRDWPVSPDVTLKQAEDAYCTLHLGDLVDFLMTGNLERRRFASEGWLRPMEYYVGRIIEPDVHLLPIQSRVAITAVMEEFGVTLPHTLSLHTLDDGRRLLYFCGYKSVGGDPALMSALSERIHWCLPRHYTLMLVDSEEYIPWPVFPNSTSPSTDVIDLNIMPGEEDEEEENEAEEVTQ